MNATARREYFATPGGRVIEDGEENGNVMLYLVSQNGVTEWEKCFFFGSRCDAAKARQAAESAIRLANQIGKPLKFQV